MLCCKVCWFVYSKSFKCYSSLWCKVSNICFCVKLVYFAFDQVMFLWNFVVFVDSSNVCFSFAWGSFSCGENCMHHSHFRRKLFWLSHGKFINHLTYFWSLRRPASLLLLMHYKFKKIFSILAYKKIKPCFRTIRI